jgi:hypothetical protein
MTKRSTVTKLLAVVAFGATGCEELSATAPTTRRSTAAIENTPTRSAPAMSAPRLLPDGRPACGNVTGRTPPKCLDEKAAANRPLAQWTRFCFVVTTRGCDPGNDADRFYWSRLSAEEQSLAREMRAPRELPDGRPAPGNVTRRTP